MVDVNDHLPIFCILDCCASRGVSQTSIRSRKGNASTINTFISLIMRTDRSEAISGSNAASYFSGFHKMMVDFCDRAIDRSHRTICACASFRKWSCRHLNWSTLRTPECCWRGCKLRALDTSAFCTNPRRVRQRNAVEDCARTFNVSVSFQFIRCFSAACEK